MNVANANVTPMMAQFLAIKEAHKDALLFYRMGDFYEMFFDDAVNAAAALDIALTKRGKHLGRDIPMCGVPFHAAEGYLLSLIKKGFRVAVCEQLEDPAEAKKRGAKSVVKRDVVRVVTPGTLIEESLLDARKNNYLAAFADVRGKTAIAWADMSTGEFQVTICPHTSLSPHLARLAASEVLVSDLIAEDLRGQIEQSGAALTPLSRSSFDSDGAKQRLMSLFSVASLDGYGNFERCELAALGAIVEYLDLTQKGKLPLLQAPSQERPSTVMQIDAATRRNLELTHALSGTKAGSLLATIDRTITGGGARLLGARLQAPSLVPEIIELRLAAIQFLTEQFDLCNQLRTQLSKTPDMDRALSRLALDRGGPRDLGAVRSGLARAADIQSILATHTLPALFQAIGAELTGFDEVSSLLCAALAQELPLLARDGGVVAPGYDDELDQMRRLKSEGRGIIASLQSTYAKETAINSLKIKHNNVLGYFIETPSSQSEKMLGGGFLVDFIHRQTTANAIRFTTLELSELETKMLNSGGRALEIETQIFGVLRDTVVQSAAGISRACRALAEIDLSAALADLASANNWCRPSIDVSNRFEITDGRHPVVEAALKTGAGLPFVANSCDLTPKSADFASIWLLTGPNMAGKSTFLRQNALIALLAQIGSFVPATKAHIGLVTQLFSRVGASDDLARGRSTFMVEMVETAAILNQARSGALVILDEIGRGTATYDGLSIAWATLEHLHDVNRCRALFATHYHELTSLSSKLDGMTNATVAVREWDGDVVFLHEVLLGAADRSYGVQVARLAGLPKAVVDRARAVLDVLEKNDQQGRGKSGALIDDLPLFSVGARPPPPARVSNLDAALKDIQPDELSPIDALNLIYKLKKLVQ